MQERHQLLQRQQQPIRGNGNSNSSSSLPPAVLVCGDFNTTPDSDTVQVCSTALQFYIDCSRMGVHALQLAGGYLYLVVTR